MKGRSLALVLNPAVSGLILTDQEFGA